MGQQAAHLEAQRHAACCCQRVADDSFHAITFSVSGASAGPSWRQRCGQTP
jgi:hypothetical protein